MAEIRVSTWLVPGEVFLPGLWAAAISLCACDLVFVYSLRERERESSCELSDVSSYEDINSIVSRPHHYDLIMDPP